MVNFQELEYKYKADDIKFSAFEALMGTLRVKKRIDVSSWDYYFSPAHKEDFIRFRDSPNVPELTRKVKTVDGNNFSRVEVDLPLDRNKCSLDVVSKFMEVVGYSENFRIYKNCFIYWLDNVNYVYYTVFDKNLKEVGRFIEVEVNKERVNFLNSEANLFAGGLSAENTLKDAAKALECLGLTPQNRMKKSLFEIFNKGELK